MENVEKVDVKVHIKGEIIPAILYRDLIDPQHDVVVYPEQEHMNPSTGVPSGKGQTLEHTLNK